jgi:hypothetical protein
MFWYGRDDLEAVCIFVTGDPEAKDRIHTVDIE